MNHDPEAAITFYGVAALVPFLALVIVLAAFLLPWITVGGEVDAAKLLSEALPAEAAKMLAGELTNLQDKPSPGLISFGTIALLWLSSESLRSSHGLNESDLWGRRNSAVLEERLTASLMTVCEAIILILVLASAVLWPQI